MKLEGNCVIKTENLSKEYRLGVIGSSTLRHDLQSRYAKLRGRPDPNRRIGANEYTEGDTFLALDSVNIEVNRGDRVGIIGANGAGKSTLLKLLARITAPTDGTIMYKGRIASMLEVGTGFHAELTGRENVYLNGAILGMTKDEISAKMDKIIAFSECEKFIDTPVKRYSSGMFVKLAFSVAAHLDAEILIMDEVLAVGDSRFQRKCIDKMRELATDESRTILYVSHNMSTIQELCNKCIVLDKGRKIFDGEVDEAIKLYLGGSNDEFFKYNYVDEEHKLPVINRRLWLETVKFLGRTDNLFLDDEPVRLELCWENREDIENLCLRIEVTDAMRYPVTAFVLENFYSGKKGEKVSKRFSLDFSRFATGRYYCAYRFFTLEPDSGRKTDVEAAAGLAIRKKTAVELKSGWSKNYGGILAGNMTLED